MHTCSSLSLVDVQSHHTDCLQTLQCISDLHTSPSIDWEANKWQRGITGHWINRRHVVIPVLRFPKWTFRLALSFLKRRIGTVIRRLLLLNVKTTHSLHWNMSLKIMTCSWFTILDRVGGQNIVANRHRCYTLAGFTCWQEVAVENRCPVFDIILTFIYPKT